MIRSVQEILDFSKKLTPIYGLYLLNEKWFGDDASKADITATWDKLWYDYHHAINFALGIAACGLVGKLI